MAEKDVSEKMLFDYHDVFADVINVLLFDNNRMVSENDLLSVKTKSQYKADDNILHEEERDIAKFWNQCEINVALFGIENQTNTDPDMVLRVIGYEGASYRSQLLSNEIDNEGKKSRYPVITLVLYFGYDKHWNKRNLFDRIDVPKYLKPYVNDFHMNLFEIAYLDDEVINNFTSDFKIVANYFSQLRKNHSYIPTTDEIRHVDEVLKLMSILTRDDRFETVQNKMIANKPNIGKGKVKDMIDVLGQVEARGEALGEARGMIKAYKDMGLSVDEIADKMGKSIDEINEILEHKQVVASI